MGADLPAPPVVRKSESSTAFNLGLRLKNALLCLAIAAIFVLTPPAGVAKPLPHTFLHLAQYIFYGLCLAAAALGGFVLEPLATAAWLRPQTLRDWNERLGYLTYGSLYLTSALLCMRMHLALFGIYEIVYPIAYIGLLITVIGLWLFISGLNQPQKFPQIDYPHYLAVIIVAIGLALSHLTWFPLAAIPGIAVFMRWRIEILECGRESEIISVSARRFKIIPFIY